MKLFRLFVVACILTFCAGRAAAQEQETPAPKTYKIYAVCAAHLDTQWNWDLTHTIREYIPRILFQNLWMLERYPDYKFNFEGGIIYRWMKEYYPLHYARLQKYIDEGRWHISGASWNANDPNMPSAESFIRNILQGQELYKREFGVRSTDIFLPDCFGFGYTLPSLAAHCGLIGFSTQKLSWRKHDFFPDAPYHKKNPFSWGVWYGIDGQSLMAAFDTGGYTAELPADAGYNKDFIRRASNGFDNTAMRYYSGGHLHGTTNCGDKGNSGTVTTARRMAEAMTDLDAPVPVIADMSSDILSRPRDVSKYAMIYGGAQKNLAPAGVTFAIIREDMLDRIQRDLPTMVDYRTHVANNSMFNTPPVFAIYALTETLNWLKSIGGVPEIYRRNQEKAALLYDEIDRNPLFVGTATEEDRSLMNICFVMADGYEELAPEFLEFAKSQGMVGIKGHRLVGGFRASCYNALPKESVEALVACMQEFARKHGK